MTPPLDKSAILGTPLPPQAIVLRLSVPPLPLEVRDVVVRGAAAAAIRQGPDGMTIVGVPERLPEAPSEPRGRGRSTPGLTGCLARVLSRVNLGDDALLATLLGCRRVGLGATGIIPAASEDRLASLPLEVVLDRDVPVDPANALMAHGLELLGELLAADPDLAADGPATLRLHLGAAGEFADRLAALLDIGGAARVSLLAEQDPLQRLKLVNGVLDATLQQRRVLADARGRAGTPGPLPLLRREELLRAELEWVRGALGPGAPAEPAAAGAGKLAERIREASLPPAVRERLLAEAARAGAATAEPAASRWMEDALSFPWELGAAPARGRAAGPEGPLPSQDDVRRALDRALLGVRRPAEDLIDLIAEARLSERGRGGAPAGRGLPCLVLAGPPGTGKKTVVRALAEADGRPLAWVRLQDARGSDDLLGRPPGTAGGGPGLLARSIRDAVRGGAGGRPRAPLILIDGVERLDADGFELARSVLRDLLDTGRRPSLEDRYLAAPLDLSRTILVATAPHPEMVPRSLRASLRTVEWPGLTDEEKLRCLARAILPSHLERVGLPADTIVVEDEAQAEIVRRAAADPGLGRVEGMVSLLCRRLAGIAASLGPAGFRVRAEDLLRLLDAGPLPAGGSRREAEVGVAHGLGWGPEGGLVYRVEWLKMPGSGRLIATGPLAAASGDTIRTAMSFVRSRAGDLRFEPDILDRHDFHVHLSAEVVRGDEAAAGLPIVLGLASILTDRPLMPGVASAGALTLRGAAVATGGVREKLIAAHRLGIRRVILPAGHEREIRSLPETVLKALDIVSIDRVESVFAQALMDIIVPSTGMAELKALSEKKSAPRE